MEARSRVGKAEDVARWVHDIATKRSDAEFEFVDINDFKLPLLDEAIPPLMGKYSQLHPKTWSAKIDSFDAYVFVTREYNHSPPRSTQEYESTSCTATGVARTAAFAVTPPHGSRKRMLWECGIYPEVLALVGVKQNVVKQSNRKTPPNRRVVS